MTDEALRKRSVTKNDELPTNGIVTLMLYNTYTRAGVPVYWSPARDMELRRILYSDFHDFWTSSVAIAITKMAALGWDLESDQPRIRDHYHDQLAAFFATEMPKVVLDYLTCDNGAFIEIVKASSSPGSLTLGLLHLDSLRCVRTGNDDTPVIYTDGLGQSHEMKQHQVIAMADMPSATMTYHGVGYSATSRALGAIRKMEAVERYIYEKVSGDRALALDLVGGVLPKDISNGVQAAKEQNEARGNTSYLGSIMVPVPSDSPISYTRIPFAELPDGFDYNDQVNNAILVYANALGMDVQDLQPLTGRPLGSGEQSQILDDKAKGKGLILFRKQITYLLNEQYLPDSVGFTITEKDVRDQQRNAQLFQTYSAATSQLVSAQILSTAEAKQILADNEIIPKEFVPEDVTPVESISGDEKPEVEAASQETTEPIETPPVEPVQPVAKEFDESKHPRDDEGKFSESGSSGGGGGGSSHSSGGGGSGGSSGGSSGGNYFAKRNMSPDYDRGTNDDFAREVAQETYRRSSKITDEPTVYRGQSAKNRIDEGFVYVTPDKQLAGYFGEVHEFRVKKGGRLFPDPEMEGQEDKRLSGRGSLKAGSAIVHTSDLISQGVKESQSSVTDDDPFDVTNTKNGYDEKSVKSVVRKFHASLRNLAVLGFVSNSSILSDVRGLVRDSIEDAYIEGLVEGGIPADEMTDDDTTAIRAIQSDQLSYVTDLVRAIRDAKGDKAQQRDILDNRVQMWTNMIESVGAQGLSSAKSNEMVTWHYDGGEHCSDCEKLNGQRHRRKWFAERNYFPGMPGAAMECGGFNCKCSLTTDSGKEFDPNQPRDDAGRWTDSGGGSGKHGGSGRGSNGGGGTSRLAPTEPHPGETPLQTRARKVMTGKYEKLIPEEMPIVEEGSQTANWGHLITVGPDYMETDSRFASAIQHEMLHTTHLEHEDEFAKVRDSGHTRIVDMHPMARQYDERSRQSEDFVASGMEWADGTRFKHDIRREWITPEQAKSRMDWFDKTFGD